MQTFRFVWEHKMAGQTVAQLYKHLLGMLYSKAVLTSVNHLFV